MGKNGGIIIKNFNVVRIDSKGRIIVPFYIRDYLGLKEGTEMIVANNGKKELRIFPLLNGSTAKISIMMADSPGSLSNIMNILSRNNIDILMSISRTIEKGKLAEWSAIVDTSGCRDINKFKTRMKKIKSVKSIEVDKK